VLTPGKYHSSNNSRTNLSHEKFSHDLQRRFEAIYFPRISRSVLHALFSPLSFTYISPSSCSSCPHPFPARASFFFRGVVIPLFPFFFRARGVTCRGRDVCARWICTVMMYASVITTWSSCTSHSRENRVAVAVRACARARSSDL